MFETVFLINMMVLLCALWMLVCNSRTARQRNHIIWHDNVRWQHFRKVSYDRHMWYLMTFRDPLKLYK